MTDRVLILAPTGRDAANSHSVLTRAGLAPTICIDVQNLIREIDIGASAVVLTEEALTQDRHSEIMRALKGQPPWSDLPFVFLSHGGPDSPAALRAMEQLGNVVLLERPVRISTLVTAVRAALRARKRQYEIRDLLEELRQADRRKDEFLAMLAHELRNPLAPVRSATDVLGMISAADSRLHKVAAVLDRQVTNLARLIDDLLDISRVTRGKIALRVERVQLADIVSRAVETSMPLMEEHRQTLEVKVPPEPVQAMWDPVRMVQVLTNLLNNASKFTPPGGHIVLHAEVVNEEARIRVRDNGIGIPRDMLARVFDLFAQLDHSLDRSRGGLGIGLTLARSIVEMHGGRITAHSEGPGLGTEFMVSLPLLTAVRADDTGVLPTIALAPGTDDLPTGRVH
jgi:signal transduction histidine kinase